MPTIRYFAAAAEASGVDEEVVDAATVGEALDSARRRHGEAMSTVLQRCSILLAGRFVDDETTAVSATDTIDVLPPFAGG